MKTKKGESMLSSGEEVPQKENYISYAITCISFLNGTFLGLLCFALGFSLGGMDHQSSYKTMEGGFGFSIANYHEISLGDIIIVVTILFILLLMIINCGIDMRVEHLW